MWSGSGVRRCGMICVAVLALVSAVSVAVFFALSYQRQRLCDTKKYGELDAAATVLLLRTTSWVPGEGHAPWRGHVRNCRTPCVTTVEECDLPRASAIVSECGEAHPERRPARAAVQTPLQVMFCIESQQRTVRHWLWRHWWERWRWDITATTEPDADVPITYAHASPLAGVATGLAPPSAMPRTGAKRADLVVAYIASNCLGWRLRFVRKLAKYIPVHSFGKCLHNADMYTMFPDCTPRSPRWRSNVCVFRKFSFVLAIENTVTEPGYITEKLWGVFGTGAIPVYWGAPDFERYVPNHSVINVRDFKSPKALAEYLHRVHNDPELYQSYFAWVGKPLPEGWTWAIQHKMGQDVFCRICELVEQRKQLHCRNNTTVAASGWC